MLDGHGTAAVAHLGNISYRLGREASFSHHPQQLSDNQLAAESFDDMKQHLVDAAGLKLSQASYRLGLTLQFDASTETFVDSPEANQLLGGHYRPGFELPSLTS